MSDESDDWRVLFQGLHLSIAQLIGATVGAGISVPVTQNMWKFFRNAQNDGGEALMLGVYTLAIAVSGTWLSLGLLGRWARSHGGRWLQFAVQVAGILAAAWMTLPGTLLLTFVLMWWQGAAREAERKDFVRLKKSPYAPPPESPEKESGKDS